MRRKRTLYHDPRVVGGIYWCGYWRHWYVVLDVQRGDYGITAIAEYSPEADGYMSPRTHMTAWDRNRDEILWEPEA